jgi:amino-acid N-acetyltransferase
MSEPTIRKARLDDVPLIHNLIMEASKKAAVIPRSQAELYETLRDFFVCDEGNGPVGCCALHITWQDLAEVKSLAVREEFRGKGIARALVNACLEEGRVFGVARIFALTAVADFFLKIGFVKIPKEELPQKVWGECVRCPKFPNCDEDAILYRT